MRTQLTRRVAMTLIELLAVLIILAVLAAIVLPRINGVASQANAATNTAVIADMNKAISTYETRYNKSPNGWDGILTDGSSGSFYAQLHPNLQTTQTSASAYNPILTTVTLTDAQAASLSQAGITFLHYNSSTFTGRPSDSGTAWGLLASGKQVAGLMIPTQSSSPAWSGHGSTFPDRAFNINPFNAGATDTFVVFGVGQPCSLRGATLQDSPIVQSADPSKYYARMLAVYRVPGPSATETFPAQFIGSFAPDGTCINDNLGRFNTVDKPLEN